MGFLLIDAGVVVGHDGSVRIIHDFDRRVDIDEVYKNLYNQAKDIYPLKSVAEEKTLSEIYKMEIFEYEK